MRSHSRHSRESVPVEEPHESEEEDQYHREENARDNPPSDDIEIFLKQFWRHAKSVVNRVDLRLQIDVGGGQVQRFGKLDPHSDRHPVSLFECLADGAQPD